MFTFPNTNLTWLQSNTIFVTKHGSHAYGTNLPSSDEDFKGIVIPPKEYFLGFNKKFEQTESRNPDIVLYDIRKFFRLAADCNPSIIEVLFTDPSDWILEGESKAYLSFGKIYDEKESFLSRKAKHTFSGYAISQLKRIKTHKRWLLKPLSKPPTRQDYGLKENREVPKEQLGAAEASILRELDLSGGVPEFSKLETIAHKLGYDDNFIDYLHREQKYRQAHQEWTQYCTWKEQRNPARAKLEAKFGYDTKHAMHLVRLLRMCREILEDGQVLVKRPDAKELLEIRAGAWNYEDLMTWAEKQDQELVEVEKRSKLPKSPDREKLNNLCINIIKEFLF